MQPSCQDVLRWSTRSNFFSIRQYDVHLARKVPVESRFVHDFTLDSWSILGCFLGSNNTMAIFRLVKDNDAVFPLASRKGVMGS